ncbi:hypothetical protein Bbelb_203870 [Branchiostoma belcheri]|nr:hypothetical protein Bbelb_203870 [Branchiostoma belcheri]
METSGGYTDEVHVEFISKPGKTWRGSRPCVASSCVHLLPGETHVCGETCSDFCTAGCHQEAFFYKPATEAIVWLIHGTIYTSVWATWQNGSSVHMCTAVNCRFLFLAFTPVCHTHAMTSRPNHKVGKIFILAKRSGNNRQRNSRFQTSLQKTSRFPAYSRGHLPTDPGCQPRTMSHSDCDLENQVRLSKVTRNTSQWRDGAFRERHAFRNTRRKRQAQNVQKNANFSLNPPRAASRSLVEARLHQGGRQVSSGPDSTCHCQTISSARSGCHGDGAVYVGVRAKCEGVNGVLKLLDRSNEESTISHTIGRVAWLRSKGFEGNCVDFADGIFMSVGFGKKMSGWGIVSSGRCPKLKCSAELTGGNGSMPENSADLTALPDRVTQLVCLRQSGSRNLLPPNYPANSRRSEPPRKPRLWESSRLQAALEKCKKTPQNDIQNQPESREFAPLAFAETETVGKLTCFADQSAPGMPTSLGAAGHTWALTCDVRRDAYR